MTGGESTNPQRDHITTLAISACVQPSIQGIPPGGGGGGGGAGAGGGGGGGGGGASGSAATGSSDVLPPALASCALRSSNSFFSASFSSAKAREAYRPYI